MLLEDDGLEIRVYARGVRVFAYAVETEALTWLMT
jgi:hypothetical protein